LAEEKKKKGFFARLKEGLGDVIWNRPIPDESMIDDLEEVLIASDIGVDTTMKIGEELRDSIRHNWLTRSDEINTALARIIEKLVDKGERNGLSTERPLIIMMTGVNGVGKTTTIAKLAHKLKEQGNSVILIAADTFRAAAAEQLSIWGERIDVPVIKHGEGADPSAVIFDGMAAAKARNADVIICDTAGRLHNKKNLMNELSKMNKVIGREYPDAARETLLVLDATTGKNAVSQAKEFNEAAELTGIVLTKMDGTAKGGIAVAIQTELGIPVKYIGYGEKIEDLKRFDAEEYVKALFA
jgi:fused signal recognition particle receptor